MDKKNMSSRNEHGTDAVERIDARIDATLRGIIKILEKQQLNYDNLQSCARNLHCSCFTRKRRQERNDVEPHSGVEENVDSRKRSRPEEKTRKDGEQMWMSEFVRDYKKKYGFLNDLTCNLAEYVLTYEAGEGEEIVSQMHGYYITRLEMASLGGDNWIHSSVVAMVTRQLNENYKEGGRKYFFEPAFADTIRAIGERSASKKICDRLKRFCDPSVMQRSFANCEQVFIPVCTSKHWFLIVLNFRDQRFEILDSRQHSRGNRITPFEKKLAKIFTIILKDMWKHGTTIPVKDFEYVVADVPGEEVSNDCGMYVIKYMEGWDNGRLTETIEKDSMALYRVTTISNLILDTTNEVKVAVLGKMTTMH